MNRIARTFLLALAVTVATSCATTQPVVTKVTHVVDCSLDQVKQQIPSIVDTVATDLLAQNYIKLLTDLAQQVGDDVVLCSVQLAESEAAHRAAAAPGEQPNAEKIKANGAAYLATREARFAQ